MSDHLASKTWKGLVLHSNVLVGESPGRDRDTNTESLNCSDHNCIVLDHWGQERY